MKFLPVLLVTLLLGMTSCESSIFEDLRPCELEVSYRYDYNLAFADAFPNNVKRVDLYVFDSAGQLATDAIRVEGDPFGENYSHTINLAPGTYTFVAWAGLYDRSFDISNVETLSQMRVAIKNASGVSEQELDPLWHGILRNVTIKGVEHEKVTIPLIKDTNKFRVQMITTNAKEALDPERYSVEITSDNGVMDGENTILSGHQMLYKPYFNQYGKLVVSGSETATGATFELLTGRLMADNEHRLVIRDKESGENIIDLDLLELIQFLRFQEHAGLPLQEYLDRADKYVATFVFSGEKPNYLAVAIYINGWLIREYDYNA